MLFTSLVSYLAQVSIDTDPEYNVATIKGLEDIFINIVRAVMGLGGIVLFIMLIMGGFNYITAGGDPQKTASARRTLTYAIGGFILMAAALLIIRLVEEITGVQVDLDVFRIYCNFNPGSGQCS